MQLSTSRRPFLTLVALALPLPVAGQHGQHAQGPESAPQETERDFLYYDYLEDGVLKGGRVAIDPSNPLMTDIPPQEESAPSSRAGASTYVTVLDNGPAANRVDVVIVGDGYTAAELGNYANQAAIVYTAFLNEPPLDAYTNYFNIHRVDVISNESGVDNDPVQGIDRDTALDMAYWCSNVERLLCVNVNSAVAEANVAPGRDQVLAIANSSKYGGAGYTDLGTVAGSNSAALEIALHEFGHSFGDLADEYTYGGPTTYSGPEPSAWNATTWTLAELEADSRRKWSRWLDLPHVSAYEGASYSVLGIYRPTSNSKMRNLGRPFEEVNTERLIRQIYQKVDPIDGASPAGPVTGGSLFVTPMQPTYHSLDIEWSVNGIPIPGATGEVLNLGDLNLPLGIYDIGVTVVDNTPMMRNGTVRRDMMTSTRTWTFVNNRVRNVPGRQGVSR